MKILRSSTIAYIMTYCIPARLIRIIHEQFLKGTINKRELARALKISRNTVRSHLSKLKLFSTQFPDDINDVNGYITFVQPRRKLSKQYTPLILYSQQYLIQS